MLGLIAAVLLNVSMLGCDTLYAPGNRNDWQVVYQSQPIYVNTGDAFVMHGTLVTASNLPNKAILNSIAIIVVPVGEAITPQNDVNKDHGLIVQSGANNIGYSAVFEPMLTVQQPRAWTAQASGQYVFALISFAASEDLPGYPTCASHAGITDMLYVISGSLEVTQVQAAQESTLFYTAPSGFVTLNSEQPVARVFNTKYIAATDTTQVSAKIELSSIDPSNATVSAYVSLLIVDKTSGAAVCFPGEAQPVIIAGDRSCLAVTHRAVVITNGKTYFKHHTMTMLDGQIRGTPGDTIVAKVDVAYLSGGLGIIINAGCSADVFGSLCMQRSPNPGTVMIMWNPL